MLTFFFFNDTATTEIYTLSLHDALPISDRGRTRDARGTWKRLRAPGGSPAPSGPGRPAHGGARVDPGEPGNALRAGGAAAGAETGAGSAASPPGAREIGDPVPSPAGSRVL